MNGKSLSDEARGFFMGEFRGFVAGVLGLDFRGCGWVFRGGIFMKENWTFFTQQKKVVV